MDCCRLLLVAQHDARVVVHAGVVRGVWRTRLHPRHPHSADVRQPQGRRRLRIQRPWQLCHAPAEADPVHNVHAHSHSQIRSERRQQRNCLITRSEGYKTSINLFDMVLNWWFDQIRDCFNWNVSITCSLNLKGLINRLFKSTILDKLILKF